MRISTVEMEVPGAEAVTVGDDTLTVDLADGRSISVPVAWYPRLVHATPQERSRWRLVGKGQGIHWRDLDEDISVEGLLAGRPSGESQTSLKKWLEQRRAHKRVTVDQLKAFASRLDGQTLVTRSRGRRFSLRVTAEGFEYAPHVSGHPRTQQWRRIERILARFNETHSLRPTDYQDITMNASYILSLIGAYLDQ